MSSLESFIHRKVVVLAENTAARDAARAMRDNQVGCVLVVDSQGRLSGVVTDRDFACRLAADYDMTNVNLWKIMTRDLVTADEGSSMDHVVQLMENHGIRRIPIMYKDGKCVGIVTLDDLLAGGWIDPAKIARIVRHQIGRRMRAVRAQKRSDAHRQETLSAFYKRISHLTGMSAERVVQVTNFLLGSLMMRITYSGATHFVAQLPQLLQEPLMGLPSGPNREITAESITNELCAKFQFNPEYAKSVVHDFFRALPEMLDPGQIRHLKSQLPLDIQELFPVTPTLAKAA